MKEKNLDGLVIRKNFELVHFRKAGKYIKIWQTNLCFDPGCKFLVDKKTAQEYLELLLGKGFLICEKSSEA